jgi:hypothetical protein
VKLRLSSRPLIAFACLALAAPVAASAADPSPTPVAAPSNPTPVAATPTQPPAPPQTTQRTFTSTRTYTPPANVAPSGPTAAQRAAAARALKLAKARTAAAARKERRQLQLLAAAQTHAEAVLRAELTEARRTDAVDRFAVSVADSIGAAPAGDLPRAAAGAAAAGSGGGSSIPLPALMLAACAALLGIGAAFASRRGAGFATAALPLIVLLLTGI